MTGHAVTGVEYVPVCDRCWEPVRLTEADDGTFEHSTPAAGPVLWEPGMPLMSGVTYRWPDNQFPVEWAGKTFTVSHS